MLLQELIDEYILLFRRGELTSSQQRELIDWLNADATHQAYYRKMLKLYACIEMTEEDLSNRCRTQYTIASINNIPPTF